MEALFLPITMKKLAFLFLIVLLAACDPTVVFREPQPEGNNDLRSFPDKVLGTYMELNDSSIYIITSSSILEKHKKDLADPETEILEDDEIELIGDSLYIKDMDIKYPIIRKNDSVFGHIVFYDTIIDLRKKCKLRKLGKNYFLNQSHDSLWIVLKLSFDRTGYAYLCDIDHEKEIEIFKQHSRVEIKKDDQGKPIKYYLSPTRKEFKTLLKLETFTDSTKYIRVSQDFLR